MRITDKLTERLQEMIFSSLKPGDKLPTELELCMQFDTSRTTVREALQALRSSGILEKKGNGTYVSNTIDDCLSNPLLVMLQLNLAEIDDLLEIRRIIETEAAGLAAKRATKENIKELENIVWKLQKPNMKLEEFIAMDVDFHLSIAKASQNAALYILIKNINSTLEKVYPRFCTIDIAITSAVPLQKEIVHAISQHNSKMAMAKMEMHISKSSATITKPVVNF